MKIKKVLLIHPPLTVGNERLADVDSFPLGLLYIGSLLLENGYDIEILDCLAESRFNIQQVDPRKFRFGLSEKNIAKRIEGAKADLVGISIPFSCQYNDALYVNAIVKRLNRQIITVAGGAHVSSAPDLVDPAIFDYCILGEGEFSFLGLLNALNADSSVKIPGVLTKDDMQNMRFSTPINFIEKLDVLPFPKYDLLPLEKYWRKESRSVNMIATRGCPFRCNFCSIHSVMGRALRLRSVDNVVTEIELLKQRFNINEIGFEDDGITDNTKWAKQLFREIAGRNFGITFKVRNGIRADAIDEELLILMKTAGFKEVVFAPESGSQKTLDNIIQKGLKLEEVEQSIILAKKIGFAVKCFLIIGFPEETKEDIANTIRYGYKLKELGVDAIWVSCAAPYPGTRLFDECLEKGIIDKKTLDLQQLSTLDSVIHNNYFSAEELKIIRNNAMRDFNPVPVFKLKNLCKKIIKAATYLVVNPKYLFQSIANIVMRKYYTR